MKRSGLRTLTAISALALVVGVIQPASASVHYRVTKPTAPVILVPASAAYISSKTISPVAPTGIPSTKFANVVVTLESAVPAGQRTLVTIKGGRSCKIAAGLSSCTISKVKIGKRVRITAKTKWVGPDKSSGYGPKSSVNYTVLAPTV